MLFVLLTACLSDIRPPGVGDGPDPASEAEARQQIEAMATAHGREAWASNSRVEMTLTDTWQGMATVLNPWPDTVMRGHVVQTPGTFDSRADFLDGTRTGDSWVLKGGIAYHVDPEGTRRTEENADAAFILPTVQYLLDLPFRIDEAPIVRSAGRQTVSGAPYDVVFATWGSPIGNLDFDQFVLYIEPDTHELAKVQYTVRDVARFVSSTSHFEDRQVTDGVLVPRRVTVTSSPSDPTDTGWKHQMVIEDLRYVANLASP